MPKVIIHTEVRVIHNKKEIGFAEFSAEHPIIKVGASIDRVTRAVDSFNHNTRAAVYIKSKLDELELKYRNQEAKANAPN